MLAATPLGNSGDASSRLREWLGAADLIAAEDTRNALHLAEVLGVRITGRIISCYEYVEQGRQAEILDAITAGQQVLLVSDAGMPAVSDPGYRIVVACIDAGLPVTCLPGPSAVLTALVLSGLPTDRFCFEGFAPRKGAQRRKWLTTLSQEPRTVIFFESPKRLEQCLSDAVELLGPERTAAVCRELTKKFEQVQRGNLAELALWAKDGLRGEITVVLAGAKPQVHDVEQYVSQVQALVEDGMRLKDACTHVVDEAQQAMTLRGGGSKPISRKQLYDAVLATRKEPEKERRKEH